MARANGATVRFEVRVELKPEVEDAEAESVARSLALLGIDGVQQVRTARIFQLEFAGLAPEEARRRTEAAVERLLANPVIHRVSVRPLAE